MQHATCKQLLDSFWSNLEAFCLNFIDAVDKDQHYILERIERFLQSFKSPQEKSKKTAKVKFADLDSLESDTQLNVEKLSLEKSDNTTNLNILHVEGNLTTLVCKLCGRSFSMALENKSHMHLDFVAKLSDAYPSRQMYANILEHCNVGNKDGGNEAVTLYKQVVLPWLLQIEQDGTDKTERILMRKIINVIFAVYRFVSTEQKMEILEDICLVSSHHLKIIHLREKLISKAYENCFNKLTLLELPFIF